MSRYFLLALPYLLQLLCIVHAIRTRRDTFWIWIIIMVPYVGGLAYLLVELAPSLLSRRRGGASLRDSVERVLVPGKKLDEVRQRATFSPTHKNMLEYADALMAAGAWREALDILRKQNDGIFKDGEDLLYKLAVASFRLGEYGEAMAYALKLRTGREAAFKELKHLALYLRVAEKAKDREAVKAEYREAIELRQDVGLELQYLRFLSPEADLAEMRAMFTKLRVDIASMKAHRIRYDAAAYKEAFAIERALARNGR